MSKVVTSELNLKSGTAKPSKKIRSVRMNSDVVFFGINGSQVSSTMAGIKLEWNGDCVVVTHEQFPGEEKWLMPAGIQHIAWEEPSGT